MIIAYIRVSTDHQNCQNQKFEIEKYCQVHQLKINRFVEEKISSRKPLHQRKLSQILKQLHPNDIIVSTEISRLGRNLLEVMGILQMCMEKGCQIWTLKENYRLGADIQSKVLAFAFSLAAEIERQLISQRVRECLARLKSEGRKLGRPIGISHKKLEKNHNQIKQMLSQKVTKAEIARQMGCTWTTLHRYINENILSVLDNDDGNNKISTS